jgi:hypothetical protein
MNTPPPARLAAALLTFLLTLSAGWTQAPPVPSPLPQAHAHNDYEHPRPLLDALAQGFGSVEADIWLIDGQLFVAHDRPDVRPERTLENLYLRPLQERAGRHGGRIYPNGPSLTLLVDVKSDATNTYRALRQVLAKYRPMLTVFHRETQRIATNAVTVIISGNRARALMASEPERLAAYDGRLADLEGAGLEAVSPQFMPLISDNWRQHFRWTGRPEAGPLPPAELEKLRSIVAQVHRSGARLRFWGMPDSPLVWQTLDEAGVDLINTDQLEALAKFLRSRR